MFVLNYKVKNRRRFLRSVLIITALFALIIFACAKNCTGSAPNTATCDEVGEYSLAAETEEQRLDILNAFGIENAELTESEEITIPEDFNSVTENYNELQKQIGLDLAPYKGKRAERLIYSLKGEKASCAVLLVCDGRLIGGHLTNREYGGSAMPLSEN